MEENINAPDGERGVYAVAQATTEPNNENAGRSATATTALGLGVNIVFAVLAALMTVAGYEYFLAPKTPRIGTVDIIAIMETFDAPTIKAIGEGNVEAAQKAAENRAKVASKLEGLLDELSKQENVVFVQKQALIGTGVQDYTAEVAKRLEDML